jgi:hypothetical protein
MQEQNEFIQWFHVVTPANEKEAAVVWGFAANEDDIILKAPFNQKWLEGETLQDVRYYFVQTKSQVIKVNPKCIKY